MGDAWIFIPVLILAFVLAVPSVRRWFSNDERTAPVDPDQRITTDEVIPAEPGAFGRRLRYRTPFHPRGRRHVAPSQPSPARVRREPPPGANQQHG